MRIISKFKDYYDSALAYGFENDRVLVRHNQAWNARGEGHPATVPVSPFLEKLQSLAKKVPAFTAFGTHGRYNTRPKDAHLQITPIVFCVGGRITKALWVLDIKSVRLNNQSQERSYERYSSYGSRYREPYIPGLNPAVERLTPSTYQLHPTETLRHDGPIFDAKEFEVLLEPWVKHYEPLSNSNYSHDTKLDSISLLKKWLEEPAPDLYAEAITEQVSVVVAHAYGLAVNPSLKDWRFFKYWDAATCMQELSMFVGNMSHPDCTPEAMPDKYRVQSHGFNEQSFRKQPTKHGLPKRAKRPHPDTPSDPSP